MSQKNDPSRYDGCIVAPMSINGDGPLIRLEHVVDAALVAAIVFFAILLGDSLLVFLNGDGLYLETGDLFQRSITAAIGGAMTFFAQWARARGIQIQNLFRER